MFGFGVKVLCMLGKSRDEYYYQKEKRISCRILLMYLRIRASLMWTQPFTRFRFLRMYSVTPGIITIMAMVAYSQ